jgi:hypothetical protein
VSSTGGPDCILRLWNFIDPNRPKTILSGHTAGIVHIFMQDNVAKIYTMDKKKVCLPNFFPTNLKALNIYLIALDH